MSPASIPHKLFRQGYSLQGAEVNGHKVLSAIDRIRREYKKTHFALTFVVVVRRMFFFIAIFFDSALDIIR